MHREMLLQTHILLKETFFFFFKAKALQHMCEYKVLWGDSTYEFLMAILLYHI